MRKKLLLGNWKMNKTIAEAKEFALASHEISAYANENGILVGVSPTYLSLQAVKENVITESMNIVQGSIPEAYISSYK